jgi:hypothetical protein
MTDEGAHVSNERQPPDTRCRHEVLKLQTSDTFYLTGRYNCMQCGAILTLDGQKWHSRSDNAD